MFCAISGEVPNEPVVSKTNGYVYERRLVEKFIKETGNCPISGLPLSEDDLVPIQVNKSVKPRPISAMSIPGLLMQMQNEWDELMLETFTLKQSLDSTRQELAQAFYQHDAACRVIARLMRERDEARSQFANLQASGFSSSSSSMVSVSDADAMDVVDAAPVCLDEGVIVAINEKCKELSSTRRHRKHADSLASKETISSTSTTNTFSPHQSSRPGVTCLSLSASGSQLLSGGADRDALLTDRESGRLIHKLSGHEKRITCVSFHVDPASDILFTASADCTVKTWKDGQIASSMKPHSRTISSLSVHPTGNYIATTSLDGSWSYLDIEHSKCLKKKSSASSSQTSNNNNSGLAYPDLMTMIGEESSTAPAPNAYISAKFHPDGLILATGSYLEGVKLWDIRERDQENVSTLTDHHAPINSLSFSENGYYLASAGGDGSVKVWDLRKLKCIKSIDFGPSSTATAVAFDHSGLYLAMAGGGGHSDAHSVRAVAVKEYQDLFETTKLTHSKVITGLCWGTDARLLVSSSLDRTIKIHTN